MASLSINREPTKEEQRNMQIIGQPQPRDKFIEEMNQQMAKASKKRLPFADFAAKDDWDEHHRLESQRLIRKYGKGYLTKEGIKEYKQPVMDWDKYSDLKNWELVATKQVRDPNISKINNMEVFITNKVYKYEGYGNTKTLPNSEHEAVMEARKKHDELWKSTNPVSEVQGSGKDKVKDSK